MLLPVYERRVERKRERACKCESEKDRKRERQRHNQRETEKKNAREREREIKKETTRVRVLVRMCAQRPIIESERQNQQSVVSGIRLLKYASSLTGSGNLRGGKEGGGARGWGRKAAAVLVAEKVVGRQRNVQKKG
mmetsp:Transcript_21915/g.35178  ORF Transcript_21915/g.35178 Transcript_21915/m.35178 type:complete len:136 (+) Transcript_21915:173-580(+)